MTKTFRLQAGATATVPQLRKYLEVCVDDLKLKWANYGIRFDLNYRFEESSLPIAADDITTIAVVGTRGRSNSRRLFYDYANQVGGMPDYPVGGFCGALIHELGHNMGLDDQYQDKDCPDRPNFDESGSPDVTYPYNIMNRHDAAWTEFSPADVAQIIRPICD
jgi:hypothetical protein